MRKQSKFERAPWVGHLEEESRGRGCLKDSEMMSDGHVARAGDARPPRIASISASRVGNLRSSPRLRLTSSSCHCFVPQPLCSVRVGLSSNMARGIEGNEIGTAKKKAPTLSTQKSSGKQQSIAGFFQKRAAPAGSNAVTPAKRTSESNGASSSFKAPQSSPDLTDLPASAGAPSSSSPPVAAHRSSQSSIEGGKNKENGMKDRSAL